MTVSGPTPFKGKIVEVAVERLTFPNGREMTLEIVKHPGGAVVVAIDEAKRVCLLRQYRPVVGDWVWELPAGKLDPGEPPEATARRELAEEAGLAAARWDNLGRLLSSPGIFTEVIHLYMAREVSTVPSAPEEHELFEVHWLPFDEALERAARGEIIDGKTVAGLFRARHRLDAEGRP